MYRIIILGLVGFALGATIGPYFAVAGLCLGLLVALGWDMLTSVKTPPGRKVIETHTERVLCVPHASIAECEMTRDARSGQWLNVRRCSLCEGEPECEKRCLLVMNDTAKKPGPWHEEVEAIA